MTLDTYLERIELEILHGPLHDLIEMTYAYDPQEDGTFFNTTLFANFVDTSQIEKAGIQSYVEDQINHYLKHIEHHLEQLPVDPNHFKLSIVRRYLVYVHDILMMVREGVPFECEKAGFPVHLSQADYEQRVGMIFRIERQWFGPLVQEEKFEVTRSFQLLEGLVTKTEQLDKSEKKRFQEYIYPLIELAAFDEQLYRSLPASTPPSGNTKLLRKVSRKNYKRIFELVIAYYCLPKQVIIDQRSSVYDGSHALHIPSHDAYEELTIQRVLQLVLHEIETHFLIQENNSKTLGGIQGAGNLIREEGLAKLHDELLAGINYDQVDITTSIPHILMGEILSGDEFREFLELYRKAVNNPTMAVGYRLRRKRNYPMKKIGSLHKDVAYSRGKFAVRGYLLNGGSYASLFYAKVDFKDMQLLEEQLDPTVKETLLYPQFVAERLLFELTEAKYEHTAFLDYLVMKYPFIDPLKVLPSSSQQEVYLQEIGELLRDDGLTSPDK